MYSAEKTFVTRLSEKLNCPIAQNIRTKNVLIPAITPIQGEIKAIYAAIFPDHQEMPTFRTTYRKIRT